MKKCNECEHFKIVSKPDKWGEGLAVCEKYNLSIDLWSHCLKSQLKKLECFKEEA